MNYNVTSINKRNNKMNMHMLFNRFTVSYNLTNSEWWVQDGFRHLGQYKTYADVTASLNEIMGL